MTALTVAAARKILGKLAIDISDESIKDDIRVAELFKNIFFTMDQLNRSRTNSSES